MKVVEKGLHGHYSLKHRFPWAEYIPRITWMDDSQSYLFIFNILSRFRS